MKLKDGFIAHEMGEQQVLVAAEGVSFNGLVRSNKTAAFIVDCLGKETTKEEIVDAMIEKYDAPKDVIERDVETILDKLKSIGALDV